MLFIGAIVVSGTIGCTIDLTLNIGNPLLWWAYSLPYVIALIAMLVQLEK